MSYNKDQFINEVMTGLNIPKTPENFRFFKAWYTKEGGKATFNPLNTTWEDGNEPDYNSVNVQNYRTFADGVKYTIKTLKQPYYKAIIDSLKVNTTAEQKHNSPGVIAALNTWGTGSFFNFLKNIKGFVYSDTGKIITTILIVILLTSLFF